jgi:hypothetical protein
MKQRIFGWISTLIGILLALALVEGVATVWLMIEDGHYTSAEDLFERTQNTYVRDMTKNTDCRYVDTLFPHPYVAFVHHANPPCGLSWVNNVGLFGTDYPTEKRTDVYTILLTGGSVASQLAQEIGPPAERYLQDELNKRYVSPTGKPFLVLNGGDGAWKQPQTFILFSLYASSVDAVVALDGFNEHFYFWSRSLVRLEAPANSFLDVNPYVADENFGDAATGWVIGRIAGALERTPLLGHSHAAYMIIRGIAAVAKSKDNFKSKKRTTLESLFAMPERLRGDPDVEAGVQLALYQKYERGIEAIARDNGVKTAYFLQPVPAFGKELTADEKTNAGDLSYRDHYRRIVEGMLTLRAHGMAVFDLGDIYDKEKGRIYADDIHCVIEPSPRRESRGYDLMAARIARDLAETWGLKEKPAN